MRAAIYTRISADRDGQGLGVTRQRKDCTELADKLGATIISTITDNDESAYRRDRRPGYRELLALIDARAVDVVIAWHPDRLHRHPAELEDFIERIEQAGATVRTCTAGDWDLSTPEGRLTARITGAVARKEVEDRSRRIKRKHAELAAAGRVGGGGSRPFGYEVDRLTLRHDEASVIRDAAERVLAGESIRSICRDWTERGIPTVRGADWQPTTVRRLLMSARISGRREHKGQITAEAEWPAIISVEQSDLLRVRLSRPSPRSAREPHRYLLMGWVHCGECGARMTARPSGGSPRYSCVKDRHGGCDRVSTAAAPLEALVVGELMGALDGKEISTPESVEPQPLLQQIDADEAALAELAEQRFVTRAITDVEYQAARRGLVARLDELRSRLSSVRTVSAVAIAGGVEAVLERWDALPLGQRRAIVGELISRIDVASVGKAGHRFQPGRVTVHWRR